MLSSIPGARVTGVKIPGISHEYSTLPGVRESVLDMMLNIKSLIIKKDSTDVEWITLTKKKGGVVTGADIKCPTGIEILNPDMYITTVDAGFDFTMSIRVEKNVGYVSIEELKKREDDVEVLVLDANFSPVQNVKYEIKTARYGELTSLDSLEMAVRTNGVMSPSDVVRFSAQMLESYFSLFNEEKLQV
jgi:DNA-directed RNA polymerase subunit alpha